MTLKHVSIMQRSWLNSARTGLLGVAVVLTCWCLPDICHGVTINLMDPSGLAAELEFTLVNPTTLEVRAKNTSTGVPIGFSNADQLLTSVSWDFGGATSITGGSVFTGLMSASLNFSISNFGANADVSGEYGYGNAGTTMLLPNFISTNVAGITPFGGTNLDGPVSLNGPQAGLVANPVIVPLGGIGAIQDEWIATITLSSSINDLSFLSSGVIVEFGSDAFYLPEPVGSGTTLLAFAAAILLRRRRSC